MILAAGFGTRLLPYTQTRPKPLFPIINTPLLLLTIQRLKRAGFNHIVVNCHYLGRQIVEAIEKIDGIVIQQEAHILGTGGGLRLALRSFIDEPVLVTNGDIYHTINYCSLYDAHLQGNAPVTMALHDFPRFNNVQVADGVVQGFNKKIRIPMSSLAFTGLQVLDPSVLEPIPLGQSWSIIDWYKKLVEDKVTIQTVRVDGRFWTDMGTVSDYLALHEGLLTRRIPWWYELGPRPEESFYLADGVHCSGELIKSDWLCAGQVRLGRNVDLARVVLWDGVVVPDGSCLRDTVVVK